MDIKKQLNKYPETPDDISVQEIEYIKNEIKLNIENPEREISRYIGLWSTHIGESYQKLTDDGKTVEINSDGIINIFDTFEDDIN